jgi:phosphotransferase system HPr (HPr) family protein
MEVTFNPSSRGVFKMKTNTKVKNINKTIKSTEEGRSLTKKADKTVEKIPAVVSFILVSKIKLCFRECAAIVKVAEDTGCLIEIAAGTKSGTSDSILSLVNLAVTADKSLVLTIHGENNHEAFNRVSKILSGKESDS